MYHTSLMKDAIDTNGEEITLQMVMNHMQLGFTSLEKRIGGLDNRIDSLEKKMDAGFSYLLDRWRWMDSHELPKRVSRLEDKVFAGLNS